MNRDKQSRTLKSIIAKSRRCAGTPNWSLRVSAVFLLCAATAAVSQAQTFTVLEKFDGFSDGDNPFTALVQGTNGDLYGTTENGGASEEGTLFKITPSGTLTTLLSFDNTDGRGPLGAMIVATNGNLYGTTYFGGASDACESGCGSIYTMTPGGTQTILHSFCSESNCTDGAQPYAALLQATDGNFYGTTALGGTNGGGIVFKMTPNGTVTTLYNFCSETNCADGETPYGTLIQATNGNFYGTTTAGGTNGDGTVFKISLTGTLATLHSFDVSDGVGPQGGLVQAANGSFYGTTTLGGTNGDGTVFEISSSGTFTSLHSFDGTDGLNLQAGLILGTDGNFYGTTAFGGSGCSGFTGCGTVFKITPGGTLTTLKILSDPSGAFPYAGLLQATNGKFYGTTVNGGSGYGTVFSLSVGLGPFVETIPTSAASGAAVKILGSNLTGATSVTFNGTPATFTVASPTLINATLPAGATTGPVQVTTPSGTLVSNAAFRVR
jgi:uncharacterized repeat protein (TIGR03803 family)